MQLQYLKRLLTALLLVCVLALSIQYSANYFRISKDIKTHMIRLMDTLQNNNMTLAGDKRETQDGNSADELLGSKTEPYTHAIENRTSTRWVVMALAVSDRMSMYYAFCIPFAVASWQRIGWKTTILVVGDTHIWKTSPVLLLVKNVTQRIDQSVKFLMISVRSNPVSYAQVGRLFATAVTPWILADDIVLTSDVDILPLNRVMYDKVKGKEEIFILNADCCGRFTWNNSRISMQPLTSIGTTLSNWKRLMEIRRLQKNETLPEYMNTWLQSYYGNRISRENVQKGGNTEWYMDQRVVSIQIHKSSIKTQKIYRHYGDRVDRSTMFGWDNFKSRTDCHMYLPSFSDKFWPNTQKLVSDVFTGSTRETLISFKPQFVNTLSRTIVQDKER